METEKLPNIDKSRIEKIVFWDYGAGALDILPVETVAQRLIYRWVAIDDNFCPLCMKHWQRNQTL